MNDFAPPARKPGGHQALRSSAARLCNLANFWNRRCQISSGGGGGKCAITQTKVFTVIELCRRTKLRSVNIEVREDYKEIH